MLVGKSGAFKLPEFPNKMRLKFLFAAFLFALIFSACGSDDPDMDVCLLDTVERVFSILENAEPGTIVGSAALESRGNGPLSYSITSGNTGNSFTIDADGQITVLNSERLDFEERQTFELTITVSASDCRNGTVEVLIYLVNTDDELSS